MHLDGAESIQDGDEQARTYMSHRRVYNAGLEDVFPITPFDAWTLFSGQRVGRGKSLLGA